MSFDYIKNLRAYTYAAARSVKGAQTWRVSGL